MEGQFSSHDSEEPFDQVLDGCWPTYKSELNIFTRLRFTERTGPEWKEQWGHDNKRCFKTWSGHFAFRIAIFTIWLCISLWSMINSEVVYDNGERYLIYLTNWGLCIELVYFGMALYCTWVCRPNHVDAAPAKPPIFVKVTWILHAVIYPGSFAIFLLYWGLVYDWKSSPQPLSVFTHGFNFVLMLVDALVCTMPYILAEYIFFLGFATIYYIWSAIHYAADIGNGRGETYIYSTLDWSTPATPLIVFVILIFVGLPLMTLLLRSFIWCRGTTSQARAVVL